MKNKIILFWIIFAIAVFSAFVVFTKPNPDGSGSFGPFNKPVKLGLDLAGGSSIILEAQTTDTIKKIII